MTDEKVTGVFDSNYYGERYFADATGIEYTDENGNTHTWGYRNAVGEWTGCAPIVEAWKQLLNPFNMLDIGCGRGTFVTYARDAGIIAEGFDFSKWAIDHPYYRCNRDWIKVHDATIKFPYQDDQFDLVINLDLMEHIYAEDCEFVIDEMVRVARKYIFLQIAIVGNGSDPSVSDTGYILQKGVPVPNELQGVAVAGHVTVQPTVFWMSKLFREGWRFRIDLVKQFSEMVPRDIIQNWTANLIILMEREE